MDEMDYFLEIFGSVTRAGPGSYECTRRAYEMMPGVTDIPRILDMGCGPGVQTVDLLKISKGTVVALDYLPLMVERTRANARRALVAERLEVLLLDMKEMDFPAASFDVIWSEGAIYNLGFENGLRAVMNFVRPNGFVVVSEAVWLMANPPASVVEFWEEYPEIDTVGNKLKVIERLGYKAEGHFVLPKSSWTEDYYDPMEDRIAEKKKEWANIPEALAVLDTANNEIELYRNYSDYYGYAFFIMSRPPA